MAIEYTPQYSLLATVSNAGTFAVQITSLPSFAVGSIISVSGLTSAYVSVNNLVSTLATVTNAGAFAVQITSLPSLAFNNSVSITNADITTIAGAISSSNMRVNIVAGGAGDGSILDGANSAIKATVLSYSNASPVAVRLSNTSGDYVSTVSISNLPLSVLATVTNAGVFAVSSLPALNITSLPNLAVGTVISVSGLTSAIVSISNLPIGVLATVTNAGTFAVQVTSFPYLALTNVVLNGQKNVTTTATSVALATSTSCKWVIVKAKSTNTGNIYVGNSTVNSANGYILTAGEPIGLDINNLITVYIDSSVNGEGVSFIGGN